MSDLLLIAQHTAKANGRIAVELQDVPIAKGLQESIHAFESLDLDIGLGRVLNGNVPEPQWERFASSICCCIPQNLSSIK